MSTLIHTCNDFTLVAANGALGVDGDASGAANGMDYLSAHGAGDVTGSNREPELSVVSCNFVVGIGGFSKCSQKAIWPRLNVYKAVFWIVPSMLLY